MNRELHHHFDEGRYGDGICNAIAQVAIQLERHFPRASEGTEYTSQESEIVEPTRSGDE